MAVSATVLWLLYTLTAGRSIGTGETSWSELIGDVPTLGWVLALAYAFVVPFATRHGGFFTLVPEGSDLRPTGIVSRLLSLATLVVVTVAALVVTGLLLGERTLAARFDSFVAFLMSPPFLVPVAAAALYCLVSPVVWPVGDALWKVSGARTGARTRRGEGGITPPTSR
ncbi:hypothetical protein ACIP5L_02150 [Streptomyces bacillaris]|uniref:hypothetical protein n=1 Tax=Streptomyces bacillaris TaxID=68179 RepID=UPI0038140D86